MPNNLIQLNIFSLTACRLLFSDSCCLRGNCFMWNLSHCHVRYIKGKVRGQKGPPGGQRTICATWIIQNFIAKWREN